MNIKVHRPGSSVKNKFKRYAGKNNYNLTAFARKGVRPDLFYDLAIVMKIPEKNLAQLIHVSPRTISNYKISNKFLDPVQSEHLLKLVSLYEKGEEIFGNIDEFNYWLQKPFWDAGEMPIDWLGTPGGVDFITDELLRLAYGDAV